MTKRMVLNLITFPRPKARRGETLYEQEKRAVEALTQMGTSMCEAGWVPLGPFTETNTLYVQQFYGMIDEEIEDGIDEEE